MKFEKTEVWGFEHALRGMRKGYRKTKNCKYETFVKKDGNKLNNDISNLEWCTYSENTKHAYENGLEKKCLGEKHHAHKLTKENVMFIREHYKPRDKQYSAVKLGEMFRVTKYTIKDVIRGKSWGWL